MKLTETASLDIRCYGLGLQELIQKAMGLQKVQVRGLQQAQELQQGLVVGAPGLEVQELVAVQEPVEEVEELLLNM